MKELSSFLISPRPKRPNEAVAKGDKADTDTEPMNHNAEPPATTG